MKNKMTKRFVKFLPWNEKILSSIINKTIKFSTVYDFNDFNEYRYLGNNSKNVAQILTEQLEKLEFKNNLMRLARETCSQKYADKISDYLESGQNEKLLREESCLMSLLEENLAFSSVGIFSASDIEVFSDDSSQLMFAHYANNLKGVALVYEVDANIEEVKYKDPPDASPPERITNWYHGKYKREDMEDFLCKSKNWICEKEKRMFAKPGIKPASDFGVQLKCVLYTPRFAGEKTTLDEINKAFYNSELMIERIYLSYEYRPPFF